MTEALTKQSANVVAMPQSSNLLEAISRAASDPNIDLSKVERLFAMHQTMEALQAEKAFNQAMADTQAKMTVVVRDAKNSHTGSTYATLAAINDAIMPIATANGFSVSFNSAECPKEGHIRTIALVSHSGGHTRQHYNDMPLDSAGAAGKVNKTAIQASGSTQSYARRYLVCQIFNITTEDDNDGNQRKRSITPTAGADENVPTERQNELKQIAADISELMADGNIEAAVKSIESAGFEADDKIYLWTLFDSAERSAIKKESKRQKDAATKAAMDAAVSKAKETKISEAQRKRLEARIGELSLDRDNVKKYCSDQYGVDHFADLTQHDYNDLDLTLESMVGK